MKTKRSIFLALGLFLAIASISTQLLSTIPITKWIGSYEIIIRVKNVEDKDELIKVCRQNKHRFKKADYLPESFLVIEIPNSTQIKTAIEQYQNLSFVESATYIDPVPLPIYTDSFERDLYIEKLPYLKVTR